MRIRLRVTGPILDYSAALEAAEKGVRGRPAVLSDGQARSIACAFAGERTPALLALLNGLDVSESALLDETTECMRAAVRRDSDHDQSALWALSRWVIDTAHSTGATSPDDCLSCAYGASAACTCGEGWQ